jgi:hypothetical protein
MTQKTNFNMVEYFSDEEQVFDQPCKWGNRVGGHSVYCHNQSTGCRKCIYRWCSQKQHEENECGGYEPNPEWTAEQEAERQRFQVS